MKHEVIDRVLLQSDGHVVIRYWTPREYKDKFPFSNEKFHNEDVDRLNTALYAKAINIPNVEVADVKPPHCYGVFHS